MKGLRGSRRTIRIQVRRAGLLVALAGLLLSALPGASTASPNSAGRLAFGSARDGDWDIYVRQADGTIGEPLVNTPVSEYDPTWSPDGTQIAFSSAVGGDFEIYVVNADGSGLQQLTNNGVLDRDPEWSPDGNTIVFARSDNASYGNEDLYTMTRNGTGWNAATLLAARDGSDRNPEYSPDGTKIAFMDYRSGKSDIYVRNSDGSGTATRLTLDARDDVIPTWSPDGTMIAFTSNRHPTHPKKTSNNSIWVMNVDGSSPPRRLTSGANDYYPDWSPDGKYIAFQRYINPELSWCIFKVEVASPNTVTNLVTGPAFDGMPDW